MIAVPGGGYDLQKCISKEATDEAFLLEYNKSKAAHSHRGSDYTFMSATSNKDSGHFKAKASSSSTSNINGL